MRLANSILMFLRSRRLPRIRDAKKRSMGKCMCFSSSHRLTCQTALEILGGRHESNLKVWSLISLERANRVLFLANVGWLSIQYRSSTVLLTIRHMVGNVQK